MSRQGILYEIRQSISTGVSMSTTPHYSGAILLAPAGKTITHICCTFSTANTSPTVDVQLETISSKFPSGTLVAAGASNLGLAVATGTFYEAALTTPYTVGASDEILCPTVRWASGGTVALRLYGAPNSEIPTAVTNTGTPTKRVGMPFVSLKFSDGTYSNGTNTSKGSNSASYTNSSAIDEYGTKFILKRNSCVIGIGASIRLATDGEAQLRIYDVNRNVLTTDAECTVNENKDASSTSSAAIAIKYFTNPLYLKPGIYYVTKTATTGNAVYTNTWEFDNQAAMDVMAPNCSLVTRADYTGAFTETALKYEAIAPIICTSFSSAVSIG